MTATPTPRARRRPRVTQVAQAMADPTKSGETMSTAAPGESTLAAAAIETSSNPIDAILDKYAGGTVPLDEAFPEPPPPQPDHPALRAQERPLQAGEPFAGHQPPQMPRGMTEDDAIRHEARLRMVHRMVMRSATVAQMAAALDVGTSEVQRLRAELKRRFRDEAGGINMLTLTGETLAFYQEVRGNMLRRGDERGLTHAERQRYALAALAAENSKHKFLTTIGFYEGAEVRPVSAENKEDDEMAVLAEALKALVDPDAFAGMVGDVIEGEPSPVDLIDHESEISLL